MDDHSIVQSGTNGSLITRSLLEIFIVLRVNGALWQKRTKLAEISVFPIKRSCVIFHASGFWHVARTDAGVSRAISQNLLDEYFVPLVATGFPCPIIDSMFPIVFAIGFQSRSSDFWLDFLIAEG